MFAALAQLVEQGTENPCVLGSIPRRGKFFIYYDGQLCPQGTCTVLTSRAVDSSDAANFLFITTDNFVHKGLAQSLRPVQSIPQMQHFCIKILLQYERWQNEIN